MNMKLRKKHKHRFIIPAYVEHNGQREYISDFPDFTVYSDRELARVLNVSAVTIGGWKKAGIIPFTKSHGYYGYRVNDVIDSLKAHGYIQESTGEQPTGHNRPD